MQASYLDAISGISLFRDIPKKELKEWLCESGYEIKKYEKDQIIHLKNDECSAMDIILKGQAKGTLYG